MLLLGSLRFACATCIRGHRPTTCDHADRSLLELRKKGRPRRAASSSCCSSSKAALCPCSSKAICSCSSGQSGCCSGGSSNSQCCSGRSRKCCSTLPPSPIAKCCSERPQPSIFLQSSKNATVLLMERHRSITFLSLHSKHLYETYLKHGMCMTIHVIQKPQRAPKEITPSPPPFPKCCKSSASMPIDPPVLPLIPDIKRPLLASPSIQVTSLLNPHFSPSCTQSPCERCLEIDPEGSEFCECGCEHRKKECEDCLRDLCVRYLLSQSDYVKGKEWARPYS